jgi:hypothetical protein
LLADVQSPMLTVKQQIVDRFENSQTFDSSRSQNMIGVINFFTVVLILDDIHSQSLQNLSVSQTMDEPFPVMRFRATTDEKRKAPHRKRINGQTITMKTCFSISPSSVLDHLNCKISEEGTHIQTSKLILVLLP